MGFNSGLKGLMDVFMLKR